MCTRLQFEGSNEIGVVSLLTNAYALACVGTSENFYSVLESELRAREKDNQALSLELRQHHTAIESWYPDFHLYQNSYIKNNIFFRLFISTST